MTTAVVLAAGRGSRLRQLTNGMPKPMTKVAGRTIIDRCLEALAAAGVKDVKIVTGYKADALRRLDFGLYGQRTSFAHNENWENTGMVASFIAAQPELLADDLLIVYGDIVFEPTVITTILDAGTCRPGITLPVNTQWHSLWSARMTDIYADAESLVLDAAGKVLEIGQPAGVHTKVQAQFMGVVAIDASSVLPLVQHYRGEITETGSARAGRWDTTQFLTSWIDAGHEVQAVPVAGGWLEVDTVEDLQLYERLHEEGLLTPLCRLL